MDIETSLAGYQSAKKRLQGSWSNPSALSDLAVKIATYGTYIGEHLGDSKAEYEVNKSKMYLDAINEKKSATQADNDSRSKNADTRAVVLKLEIIHKDLFSLVSVIQSRLKVLESEARNNV
jgi:Na+/glutamate symporter